MCDRNMIISSLGFQTNFIFSRFSGSVTDRGSYTVIATPSNPGYHWGNFLIFDRAPKPGDLKAWKAVFDREFPGYKTPNHYLFAWEKPGSNQNDYQEFLDAGFEFEPSLVLAAKQLKSPPHLNKDIRIQKMTADRDWDDVIALQMRCADPKYLADYAAHERFKRAQFAEYRKLSEAGRGFWFGAYLGSVLVADLGIFYEGKIGRYQVVETHPDYRKKGICGSLVYEAGTTAFKEFGVTELVMEADPDYHAARIYESVGFLPGSTTYSLSWWRGRT